MSVGGFYNYLVIIVKYGLYKPEAVDKHINLALILYFMCTVTDKMS